MEKIRSVVLIWRLYFTLALNYRVKIIQVKSLGLCYVSNLLLELSEYLGEYLSICLEYIQWLKWTARAGGVPFQGRLTSPG